MAGTCFHNSPTRRENSKTKTDSTTYPLNFCETRWAEDDKIAQRAIKFGQTLKDMLLKC